MSTLNYILTVIAVVAIIYSYSVGSATGIVIWLVVLGLNVALILIQRMKNRKQ